MNFNTGKFAASAAFGTLMCLTTGLALAQDSGTLTAHLSKSSANEITVTKPVLVDVKDATCRALPGVPNPTPFPFSIRVGGLMTPTTKLLAGVDVTIPELHLLPSMTTRIDGDVIFGANLGGSQTLIPVTIDQLYTKALPSGTSVYFGGGLGMYFGGKSRFGGKLAAGASVKNLGVEGDLLFSGYGSPYFSLMARIGL